MVNTNTPKFLKRFITNRKGTAEVIGSVLFIIILLFAFTNIYLWHDNATKTMNTLLSEKLNSQIQVYWSNDTVDTLVVTNTGGVGTVLSRLWITTNAGDHRYSDLENVGNPAEGLYVGAGSTVTIKLQGPTSPVSSTLPIDRTVTRTTATVSYNRADGKTFTILTTLGNMASPRGTLTIVNQIGGDGGNGNNNSPVGSVIVANFSTFNYYPVSGSSLGSPSNGYNINSNGADVAFSVVLTNQDTNHRNIVLNYNSQMFFIDTFNPTKVGYLIFYTVNVDNNGNISPTYVNVNLDYGKPTTVYFASANAIVGSSHYTAKTLVTTGSKADPGVYPLNLALLGSFSDGSILGQNVPFVSVYINS